jgi:hypothetical protein
MQTFVPFTDLNHCAASLDNKRLNKQLLEGRQIYKILSSSQRTGAWVNHPAVKMWRNYDMGLYAYLVAIYEECVMRDIKADKNWEEIEKMHESNWHRGDKIVMPAWWGDHRVHESHKFNLYRKDGDHYYYFNDAQNFVCCDRCNYFWPTHTLYYNLEV